MNSKKVSRFFTAIMGMLLWALCSAIFFGVFVGWLEIVNSFHLSPHVDVAVLFGVPAFITMITVAVGYANEGEDKDESSTSQPK